MESVDHRALATATYNACWELLERADRSAEDDATLLTSAFASRFHWRRAGQLEQWVISDWMVSRAAAAVGHGELAVDYARRAREAAEGGPVADWLLASTAEGLARAHAAAGQTVETEAWRETAARLVAEIADDEDREIIAGQVATIPR